MIKLLVARAPWRLRLDSRPCIQAQEVHTGETPVPRKVDV
jgi:hypothetical protein